MHTTVEKIYDDYRNADFSGRLNIYLQFPELREDFYDIDLVETARIGNGRGAKKSRPNPVTRIFNRCLSFLF